MRLFVSDKIYVPKIESVSDGDECKTTITLHYVIEILHNYVPQCISIVVIALNTTIIARIMRDDQNCAKLMRVAGVKSSRYT